MVSFTLLTNENCTTQLTSEVYQDTASKSFLMMCEPITNTTTQTCKTLDYTFTDKSGVTKPVDLKTVYALNFYLKNSAEIKLSYSFCSLDNEGKEQWTKLNTEIFKESIAGYRSFALVISPVTPAFQVNAVSKIHISINTATDFMLDELGLVYYTVDKNKPDFEVKKQLKKVKEEFKDKKDKDRAERWVRDRGGLNN